MDGREGEKHHKVDLLRELADVCRKEGVETATKTIIDKYHALGECVSYHRYLEAFNGKDNLDSRLREHMGLPEKIAEPSLFA